MTGSAALRLAEPPASPTRHAAEPEESVAPDQLSNKNFKRLAELIHGYSGIKMPPSKRTMLEGRLRRRMRATRIGTLNDYCRYLFDDEGLDGEIVHLIDAVTTNKTEFFREPAHFRFLSERALPALAKRGGRMIKAIGTAARKDISEAHGATVHLFLHVKVRERWLDDPERYRAMGLDFPKG